jgi:propanediol dehydratase small subunit
VANPDDTADVIEQSKALQAEVAASGMSGEQIAGDVASLRAEVDALRVDAGVLRRAGRRDRMQIWFQGATLLLVACLAIVTAWNTFRTDAANRDAAFAAALAQANAVNAHQQCQAGNEIRAQAASLWQDDNVKWSFILDQLQPGPVRDQLTALQESQRQHASSTYQPVSCPPLPADAPAPSVPPTAASLPPPP